VDRRHAKRAAGCRLPATGCRQERRATGCRLPATGKRRGLPAAGYRLPAAGKRREEGYRREKRAAGRRRGVQAREEGCRDERSSRCVDQGLTVMVPVIVVGWIEQMYPKVPGVVNVNEKVPLDFAPESHAPPFAVVVWVPETNDQTTVSPAEIGRLDGLN
jgi:hypothetical protein